MTQLNTAYPATEDAENPGVCHRHTSWRYKEIAVRCV